MWSNVCRKYYVIVAFISVPFLPSIVSLFEFCFFGTCFFDRFVRGLFGLDIYFYVNVFPLVKLRSIFGI